MKAARTRSQRVAPEGWKKIVRVVREPLHVEAFVTKSGRLGFFVTLGEGYPKTVMFRRVLTRPETHRFFARLASVLGYEVEKSRRGGKVQPAWIRVSSRIRPKRSGEHCSTKRKNRPIILGMRDSATADSMARISVPVPRRTLLRLCRAIAEDLDWELTEAG